ncbi:Immunoglobulin-like domain of spore germination [Halobacillus karajensis]|uniref:BsuPI n=1 Tax=Halobacillus karajensis TaxID=195088 RepID=A0A024P7R4_9BACI|nr:BsuPI-related putative proteinase inhibitor [Halobacillus karajensis]CDQ21053.1 BsuPI [Halobacillus karajensis]CDQ24883.1 BsuPI [Halobacillus karajensis]CDQ28757.1 BsuPI [Halobacillus karajensis]SEH96878.1 Immunoglobulin-like domain of spore germination [Halobacillus karajensis]
MKKFLVILLGTLMLLLAACTDDSNNEANGEGKEDQMNEEQSNQEAEVDMEALIDQVAMDATIDTTEDTAAFNFSLVNNGEEPIILGFTSSQKYDIKVTNEEGEEVYSFSADKMFTQQLTTEELAEGDRFDVEETWTGIEEPGEYEATMTFLVNTINDQPIEATPFQVTQKFTIEDKPEGEEEQDGQDTDEDNVPTSEHDGDGQAFRDITVTGENGTYVVKGEARVYEGSFMYSVEDGHNVQVEPTASQVKEGAPSWSSFEIEINIPVDDLPDFGTLTLTLFEESAEDGAPTNVNYIPLETFQSAE